MAISSHESIHKAVVVPNLVANIRAFNSQLSTTINNQTTPNYAQALRQTKLKMLRNPMTSTPRYWAAFVMTGG